MSSGKQTRSEAFDAELDGQDVCVEFDRVTKWSTDPNYGADADGNRGISVTEIDEDYAENIFVLTFEQGADGTKEISTPLSALTSLQALEVQRLVDEHLEQHEPTEPEEPDYDGPDNDADLDPPEPSYDD